MASKKIKLIAIMTTLIAVLSVGGLLFKGHKSAKTNDVQPTLVKVSTVQTRPLPNTVSATAHLIANQKTDISPKASGYVVHTNYQDGHQVQQGQVLIQLDNRKELDALAAAKAKLALSQLQYQRNHKLYQRKLILQDAYYQAKVNYEQALAAYQAAETALADKTLLAPFSGTMGATTFSLGAYVNPGQALVPLVDKAHLIIIYSLPSTYVDRIKLGQRIWISNDASPAKKATAAVSYISPTIDTDTQTISVHAVMDNSHDWFKPGQFVNVIQDLGGTQQAVMIPSNSMLASLEGAHVFIVKNNKAVQVLIKIGQRVSGKVAVTSGLTPGEQLIVAGQSQLRDGQAVTISQPKKTS